jgi:Ca2+/Na+ antiporter
VAEDTFIDWWIMTRDTVLFLFYLSIMAYLLYGNKINKTKAIILMAVYVVHIILMKFSSKYEIIIKHNLANIMEIGELKKIATKDISAFHRTLRT